MIEESICITINGDVENSTITGSCQNEIVPQFRRTAKRRNIAKKKGT